MTPERRQELVLLRRARDLIDRRYAQPLDVPAIAAAVHLSTAHFSRRFRAVYGETPYQYLMTRRIERACALLRGGLSVTEACMRVGCTSLGSFSSRFTELVGTTPSAYRAAEHPAEALMPDCTARAVTRPARQPRAASPAGTSRIREATATAAA
ncbi:helix-turn-helix transcriptional regulator [Amnibacterium setariae]|uniref:AraC family transcriptional regulator n=1 Tax=Amnibacterium setariae TaxID=2306585 RepID=A0A3A1U2N6_9MICO|nr:helix-turn-helix transcriptional regulator [Amnibacterium setariae]RIX30643.1 AraC family transcriptional regulator [Amnibacterium setariae]